MVESPNLWQFDRGGSLAENGTGIFHRDLYVAADQIDHISDDAVHLRVGKDHLAKEA